MLAKNIYLGDQTVLITGVAGFIGSHLAMRLIKEYKSIRIVGVDSMTDYYDVNLKKSRIEEIEKLNGKFCFYQESITDKSFIDRIFKEKQIDVVVNLAAQAGVRYSITNPDAFIESNLEGFYNILDACGRYKIKHLVYASSSSVYGNNRKTPYSVEDKCANPLSLYAATKMCNELLAHSQSVICNLPTTGLRFFTVYGPLGRPDMAYFSFTEKLRKGEKIKVFNYGKCRRDFTYVDDIVEGILRVMEHVPERQEMPDGTANPPYRLYNIGNSSPENLLDFVDTLYEELVKGCILPKDFDIKAHIDLVPMQPGDVPETFADTTPLERDFGYKPSTTLRTGLRAFVIWYKEYYKC